ncbi:hypothetical protein J7K86_02755 [bacterium]|nr:hypothetical protein [bacterium]
MRTKILLTIGISLVLLGAIVFIVKAGTTADTSLSVTINPGTLQVQAPASATFTEVNLDDIPDTGTDTTATISPVKIKDHRAGTPAGWSVTMTNTDFVSGSDTIAVTNLTVTPGDITAVGNSSLDGITKGSAHTFTSTSDPATLATADAGYGRGRFNQDEDLSLFIDVSTAPGTYSATSTITIASLSPTIF